MASYLEPQKSFPIPQCVPDQGDESWAAGSLWPIEPGGCAIDGLQLTTAGTPAMTASNLSGTAVVERLVWARRESAY